jgi:hypothetical protein
MDYIIDLAPHLSLLYNLFMPALQVLLTAVVGWAVYKITPMVLAFLHIKSEVADNKRLQEFIGRGIAFGLSRLGQTLDGKKLEFHTKHEAIAIGSQYVATGAPSILKKFGVTPERLAELVEARLGELQYKANTTEQPK